jgi:hypothetical protein
MNIENIELTGLLLQADNGFSVVDANGVKIENIKLTTKSKTAFEFLNCKNVKMKEIESNVKTASAITINGKQSENISLLSSGNTDLKEYTKIGQEVPKTAVNF